MELLFAGLAGLILGALAGLLPRHRDLLGKVLPAAVGGIVALVAWELLTWLGAVKGFEWLRYDQGWIWWITLLLAAGIAYLVARSVSEGRAARDADLLDRLSKVGRTKPRRRAASAAGATAAEAREDQAEREVEAAVGDADAAPADDVAEAEAEDMAEAGAAEEAADAADGDADADADAEAAADPEAAADDELDAERR